MFSISKKIYDYFNYDCGEETGMGIILFILGIILYFVTIFGKDHLTIPTPYWQIIAVAVPIIMFIMIEWIYIDDCKYDTTLKVWRDYFYAKLLAIVTGIYVSTLGKSGVIKALSKLDMPYYDSEKISFRHSGPYSFVEIQFCIPYYSMRSLVEFSENNNAGIAFSNGKLELTFLNRKTMRTFKPKKVIFI